MLGCFDFLILRWSFVTGAVSGWESYRWYSCDSFGRSIRGGAHWHIAQIPCRGRLLVSFEKNHNPKKMRMSHWSMASHRSRLFRAVAWWRFISHGPTWQMMVPAPLPNIYATNPSSGRVHGRTWPNRHHREHLKPWAKDMERKGLEDHILVANNNPSKSFEGRWI